MGKLITSMNRFKRYHEKILKRVAKARRWNAFDWLNDNESDLRNYYRMGYQQGRRDAIKELNNNQ